MADPISDEAFDAMPLSKQLEFVASHLHNADETSLRTLSNEDVSTMLMHCMCMARHAAGMERTARALERELAQHRDDAKLRILRLEIAFGQSEEPGSNVIGWPIIRRSQPDNTTRGDLPEGAA